MSHLPEPEHVLAVGDVVVVTSQVYELACPAGTEAGIAYIVDLTAKGGSVLYVLEGHMEWYFRANELKWRGLTNALGLPARAD